MITNANKVASTVLTVMNEAVGTDCYRETFSTLLNKVADLDSASRFQQIGLCEKAFAVPAFRTDEATRVGAAKMLVALLPDSALVLKRWLCKDRPRSIHEVHFSLFCYLEEVQHFDNLKPARKSVLDLVASYLMKSRGDKAQACWMAADLLGDHWNLRDSLPRLLTAAETAKAPVARVAAITGLAKALDRCSSKERVRIRNTLEAVAKNDRSRAVKVAATGCLNDHAQEKNGSVSPPKR